MYDWFVALRKQQGFTQEKIAGKINTTRQLISAIENGSRPSVETAKKLGNILEFDWTRFFDSQVK